jgi:hypothetical protein
MMLVHPSFNYTAVREHLEQELKGSPIWKAYQYHRGATLERLGGEALSRLLPGAEKLASFEYFIPANEDEHSGPPDAYTKNE